METTTAWLQMVGKIRYDKLRMKINLRTGFKTSKEPFMKKQECHQVQLILMALGAL